MELELAAILIVITGLIVQERGMMLTNAGCFFISEAGERSAGFGALIAICAAPWVAIGIALSHIA